MTDWYILMAGVIILSGIGSIIEKRTLFKEHAMEFSAVFSILIFLFSLPLIPYLNLTFSSSFWLPLYILSIILAVAFLFVAKASRHMELSSSSPLFAFGPVITAGLAWLFLKETLTISQLGGIGMIFLGSYLLEMKSKKSFIKELGTPFKTIIRSKYIHFMLFAIFLYAVSATITRFFLNTSNPSHLEPITLLFIINMFVAFNLFVMISIFHDGYKGIMHGIQSAGGWIALMAIVILANRLLMSYAMAIPSAKIALVIAFRRTSLIISTFFGGKLFKDKHLTQKTFAAIIMVFGAIILII